MRILWVKADGLWPLNTGGRLRSFHILAELSSRHRVTLATTHGAGEDPGELREALPRCERVISVLHAPPRLGGLRGAGQILRAGISRWPVHARRWRVPALRALVEQIMTPERTDLCLVDFLKAAPNVPMGGVVPAVLFAHNAEHVIWQRLSRLDGQRWRRAALEIEWRKMRAWEARVCARAALTLAVSEDDRRVLSALAPGSRVRAIPTGVDLAYFTPGGRPEVPGRLVFTGSMDWSPNEDAMLYFIGDILPLIRAGLPAVSLTIAGRNPTPRLREAAEAAGVCVTGTVDDIRPFVAEAAVYVVPLRAGSGTRLKLFEALAMGKPVVSTALGAEGLPVAAGRHVLLADTPAEFAHAALSLLRDPAQRKALGLAGRRLVEERCSWSQVTREFEVHCEEVLNGHAH